MAFSSGAYSRFIDLMGHCRQRVCATAGLAHSHEDVHGFASTRITLGSDDYLLYRPGLLLDDRVLECHHDPRSRVRTIQLTSPIGGWCKTAS